jgi:hypothetical protein
MNIKLKKVTWDPENPPSTSQTLTLNFRKQDAPDEADSYTQVTDSLYVLANGTVVDPPLIRGLDNSTTYLFRLINTDSSGGSLDVLYTTPEELKITKLTNQYTPNSRLDYYQADAGFYGGMVPSGIAFYSMENNFKELISGQGNISERGVVSIKKVQGYTGMYVDCQQGSMVAYDQTMDSMFGMDPSRAYTWGVYFHVASADLPATGKLPLLSCFDNDGYGSCVYIDNATKEIVWEQKNATLTETMRSSKPIVLDSWNNIIVGTYTLQFSNTPSNLFILNGEEVGTGTISASSLPDTLSTDAYLFVGGVVSGVNYTGKATFRNVLLTTVLTAGSNSINFNGINHPIGYLQDKYDPTKIITIPHDHLIAISKTSISFTIPQNVPPSGYSFYVKYLNGYRSTTPIDVYVSPVSQYTNAFNFDMTNGESGNQTTYFQYSFYAMGENEDGGADGGVVPRNIYFKDGMVVLEAHGDWYDGVVQGVDADGVFKKHTDPNDPLLGENWKTRVGAAVATQGYYGYGSFIVEAKLPKQLGVAPFFKLQHHARAQFQDPYYEQCLSHGLHQQGSVYDDQGFYAIANNEISMELPSNDSVYRFYSLAEIENMVFTAPYAGMRVSVEYDTPENTGTWQLNNPAAPTALTSWLKVSDDVHYLYQPRRDQVKVTNAKGFLGNGVGFDYSGSDGQDEFLEMRALIGKDLWDDAFHEFRIDWYANKVDYFVDGVLVRSNPYFVPDIASRFSFGLKFPSEPMNGTSWLPDPQQLSAGAAAWHHQAMTVRRVAYQPFTSDVAGGTNRVVGETHPFKSLYSFPALPA